jgi:hypothetical protein
MIRRLLMLLMATVLLCGCIGVNKEGEDDMSEPLLTREEFLRIVAENKVALGVTVSDFNDVDIDEFIEYLELTEVYLYERFIMGSGVFKKRYENFLLRLENRRFAAFQSQELIIADSTDEEYETFKAMFFERIPEVTKEREYHSTGSDFFDSYTFETENGEVGGFTIGRTMHIDELRSEGWRFQGNPAHAYRPGDDLAPATIVYLSANGKFFLLCGRQLYILQAFCELEY